jgi:hypothetical protein
MIVRRSPVCHVYSLLDFVLSSILKCLGATGRTSSAFGSKNWCGALPLDGFLHNLIDEVTQRLGEGVGGVAHRCCLGSSAR